MPPKKDKEAKVPQLKGDEAETEILAYLKQQNRPYNSTDVSLNMRTVSKPVATKALAALAEKSSIVAKPYGKQIIYAMKQDAPKEEEGQDNLEEIKKDISAASSKMTELKEGVKALTSKRDKLLIQHSTADLPEMLTKLVSETETAQQRLTKLKEEPDSLISTSDLTTQDVAHAQAYKLWVGRKKAFNTLLDAMTDQMDKQQREELLDELFDGVPDEGEEAKRIVEEEKAKLLRPVKRRKVE